jgi:TolB-like protein
VGGILRKFFLSILIFCSLAFATAEQTVAVLPSESIQGALDDERLDLLTDKIREAMLGVLPANDFALLTQDAVIRRLGGIDNYVRECIESSCIVDLGRKANVDYVMQGQVSRLDDNLRIKIELYRVSSGALLGTLNDFSAKDIYELLSVVKEKIPSAFANKFFPSVPLPLEEIEKTVSPEPALDSLQVEQDVQLEYERTFVFEDDFKEEKKPFISNSTLGLLMGALGVVFINFGLEKNKEVNASSHEDTLEEVKNKKIQRNVLCVLGISSFAFGVYLWF